MLNPVDLAVVFAHDRVHGTVPDEIHPAVAWWVGSCLVLTTRAHGVALVHDGTALAKEFTDRFCRGAINCAHYGATVSVVGEGGDDLLAYAIRTLQVPGALITTAGRHVTIRLFAASGAPITEDTGLERICDLIARDKVPIPVNDTARGRIVHRRDLAQHYAAAEG
ncbi:hypothetical protein [Kitasatospora sp. GP82]|uniref:hypothetical protein n=1 Tax=Kitasatospora sp. GP82 TaxID=3035089 RepID=UPI002476FA62|nr:hypothetical protein [Kitasatospora sp. GP82]MDH6127964.1 phosphomannomutase [Kitasatospora sp. GP82]